MQKNPGTQRGISIFNGLTVTACLFLATACDDSNPEFSDDHAPFLPNGSFEKGLEGWTLSGKNGVSIVKTDVHSGASALRIATESSAVQLSSPRFPVAAGKTYRVTLWVKTIRPGAASFQFRFYTLDEHAIGVPTPTPAPSPAASASPEQTPEATPTPSPTPPPVPEPTPVTVSFPAQAGGWQKLDVTIAAPPDANTAEFYILAPRNNAEFRLDDAAVVEVGTQP